MTPTEAGFDGCSGIRLPMGGENNTRFVFERGSKPPSMLPEQDYRERMLWHYPDNAPARLLWCNAKNQWFELSFMPIEQP
jgi:hypothetical protein